MVIPTVMNMILLFYINKFISSSYWAQLSWQRCWCMERMEFERITLQSMT